MKRNKTRLSVDVDQELYARIRASADEAGQALTVWMVRAALAKLEREQRQVEMTSERKAG